MRIASPLGRLVALLLALVLSIQPALAQSVLRDAETEALFAEMSAKIIEAGGLQPRHVQIVLLQDKEINAFVAGGQIVWNTDGHCLYFWSMVRLMRLTKSSADVTVGTSRIRTM